MFRRFEPVTVLVLAGTLTTGAGYARQGTPNTTTSTADASRRQNPIPLTADSIAVGKRAYDTNCAACHGNTAQGASKAGLTISIVAEQGGRQPPDLTDAQWDHGPTDGEIFTVIKRGVPPTMMAGWEGRLSDAEIWSIVHYIRAVAADPGLAVAGSATANAPPRRRLDLADYARMPITGDIGGENTRGLLARVNFLRDEPGGARFFVNDLNGPLYILDKQTRQFTTYLDFNGLAGRPGLFAKFTFERNFAMGLINFVFDPAYRQNGVFYTLHAEDPTGEGSAAPRPGLVPGLDLDGYRTTPAITTPAQPGAVINREIVLIEWTDRDIHNATFEGTARELLRLQQPGPIHPLGEFTFNPAARPGDPDWRVMYLGSGDAGTGEQRDIRRMNPQRLDTLVGKILRLVPDLREHSSTSTVSENGRYRIPNDNPFVAVDGARGEIWALGVRNPHRLVWDFFATPS
jgi:mono/diheme cytochrome c family protein